MLRSSIQLARGVKHAAAAAARPLVAQCTQRALCAAATHAPIDTLFIVGRHYNECKERATVPIVLANIEVEKPGRKVEVCLMFGAAEMAVEGQIEGANIGKPWEDFDLRTRLEQFVAKGGVVSVCTPCLVHRNYDPATVKLYGGIGMIKGTDMLLKQDAAKNVLSFV